jgi:uncharacterized membrane protein YraQ (UPF0718 family)
MIQTFKKLNTLLIAGLFLLTVVAVVRIFFDASFEFNSSIQNLLSLSIAVIIESTPFVILGIALSALLQKFVAYDKVAKFLPKNTFVRRGLLSLLGVFIPVCECGNVPLARGLILKGFTVPEATTFLLAAPILNPLTIITTYQAFGWDNGILLGRIIGGFIIANLIGWYFSLHTSPHELLTEKFEASCSHAHGKGHETKFFNTFVTEVSVIMPTLILGSFIAGAIHAFVPQNFLTQVGSNPVAAVLVMIVMAFVIAICSNVDAFFALSFANIFPSYAILVFLLIGPLVDIKMLALLKTTFKSRTVLTIAALVVILSVTISLGVSVFYG